MRANLPMAPGAGDTEIVLGNNGVRELRKDTKLDSARVDPPRPQGHSPSIDRIPMIAMEGLG